MTRLLRLGTRPNPPYCLCGSARHRPLTGDGPALCPVALLSLGDAVARPDLAPPQMLRALAELHGDVCALVGRTVVVPVLNHRGLGSTAQTRVEWHWTADWPDAEPLEAKIQARLAALKAKPDDPEGVAA